VNTAACHPVLTSTRRGYGSYRDRPPSPRWPAEFQALARRLRASLGGRALRIDHIGSTAVPALPAKDIIDIQVTVAALDEGIAAALAPLGYTRIPTIDRDHAPPGHQDAPEEWAKQIYRPPAGQRPTNLHVRQAGRANQRYALLFRDYLRADAPARAAYAQIKQALARLHPDDLEAYYTVKDPVCDLIMGACRTRNAERGTRKGRIPQSSEDGPAAMLTAIESGYPQCVQPSTNAVTRPASAAGSTEGGTANAERGRSRGAPVPGIHVEGLNQRKHGNVGNAHLYQRRQLRLGPPVRPPQHPNPRS
jgi:GrpB-like predicted nucleotidyltransferase (UPF0157 family)